MRGKGKGGSIIISVCGSKRAFGWLMCVLIGAVLAPTAETRSSERWAGSEGRVEPNSIPSGLMARRLPFKPVQTVVNPAIHDSGRLVVKFRDDLLIRVRGGALTDDGSGHLASAQAALQGLTGASWTPSHRLTEAKLDELRANAQSKLRRAVADLNVEFTVELPAGISAAEACDALNALDIVELASPMPLPLPAPFVPPDFRPMQGYLNAPSGGINAQAMWNLPGGTGAGIKIADIEYSWNLSHEDLSQTTLIGPAWVDPFGSTNHGTAVLGQIGSLNNGWGTTGIAYDATMYVVAANTSSGYNVAAAITQALGTLGPGDVILIEQQTFGPNYTGQPPGTQFGLVPSEWNSSVYNAVVTAVGNGVVVVAAAGNGSQDLDDPVYHAGHAPFLPENDSGAIIVGAGAPPGHSNGDRSRLWFSNYGSRVNLQGWGTLVTTTGYGDLYSSEGIDLWYTSTFGGTSSASPIVAGACILLQSAYIAQAGDELTPAQIRAALSLTGSPQLDGTYPASQNIGPRPDALAAFNLITNPSSPPGVADDVCFGGSGDGGPCTVHGDCADGGVCGLKSRFISVTPGSSLARGVGEPVSIQVTVTSMPQFPEREGEVWWAGPTQIIPNSPFAPLAGAELFCEPVPSHAEEWPTAPLHLFGAAIIPGSEYAVRMCDATGMFCSDPLLVGTGVWGDVTAPYGGLPQPDFGDISAIITKFSAAASSVHTPRADLVGTGGSGQPNVPDLAITFSDVSNGLDAFRGEAYPYTVPSCP